MTQAVPTVFNTTKVDGAHCSIRRWEDGLALLLYLCLRGPDLEIYLHSTIILMNTGFVQEPCGCECTVNLPPQTRISPCVSDKRRITSIKARAVVKSRSEPTHRCVCMSFNVDRGLLEVIRMEV